jgi:pSer/pThr/pTyr-binding forkhead associated (FHA) protein
LDDSKVSSEHARIRMEQGGFVLYDLASTNCTYVNGQQIQKQMLRDGDQIKFGPNATLVFMRVGK